MREMHTRINNQMIGGGKIGSFLLWVHLCGQLQILMMSLSLCLSTGSMAKLLIFL
jgi:hypothetical protein